MAAVPFVYRYYPTVRAARARVAAGEAGALRLLHGHYLQDWLVQGADTDWRVDAVHGGAPGRSPTSARTGATWWSSSPATASLRCVAHTAGGGAQSTVLFTTDRGASGSVVVSQASPGRKNSLVATLDGDDASFGFDQEQPENLRIGTVAENRGGAARSVGLGRRRALSVLPPGHPQGYQDCFAAFVRDCYAAIRGERPDGLPTFDDGRGPPRCSTPSSPRARPRPGWRYPHEARFPDRVPARPSRCPRSPRGPRRTATRRWRSRPGRDLGARPFTATHLDAANFDARAADATRELFERHGLTLSSLAFYENNLHPDPAERRAINEHVAACIDAAALLGCPTVGTFVGRDPGRSVAENLARRREGVRPARGPGRGEGRPAHHRELRDGGLAPGRLPGQPRLLPRAVGVDVLDRPLPQLRPVPPGVARHRPGRGAAALRRPDPARAGQGRAARSRSAATATAGRARPSCARTRGTSAGGATACPDSATSTGRRRRHALRGRVRRRAVRRARGPRLGRRPKTRSTPVCRSPTARCAR